MLIAGSKEEMSTLGRNSDDPTRATATRMPVVVRAQSSIKGLRGFLALVAAVGPLFLFGLVIILGALWEGYDPIRDTQSKLGAVDSPYRMLMNVAGFMGIGVAIICFAGAYGLTLRSSSARQFAIGLLAIAGASMIVVGFFPCDAGCVDITMTGRLHSVFSMPGAIGLPVAAMISSLAFRSDGRFGPGWQMVSFWLGLITLASGPLVAAEMLEGVSGLAQRAGMWSSLVWMEAVSLKLYGLGRPTGHP